MAEIKITDKAGVTLKTAGKYCSEDIGVTIDESLLGSGELTSPTAVPISGMVEKVYLNFNLDVNKMAEVIEGLTFLEVGLSYPVYPIVTNADMSGGLFIGKLSEKDFMIINTNGSIAQIHYVDAESQYNIVLYEEIDYTQPLEFGFENMVEALSANSPTYVNSNELLKEMISITPIQKIGGSGGIEDIIEVEELPEPYIGTAVPNSGTVEKVYLNTSLTNEEVVSILDTLPLNEAGQYYALAVENTSMLLCSRGSTTGFEGNDYGISDFITGKIYFQLSKGGWREFENPIEINGTLITEASGIYIGTANHKISSLISTTPFELNTELDKSKIYFVNIEMGDIYAYLGSWGSMKDFIEGFGGKIQSIVVKDKPTENIKVTDLYNMMMYGYFVENENDIFLYGDWAGDGTPFWLSFSEVIFGGEATYGGQITDVSEATDPTKYYTMPIQTFYKYSNGWVEYVYNGIFPTGTKTITKEGTYNVKEYENVDVQTTSGTLTVTGIGTVDVTSYKNVKIDTLENFITNGTYDSNSTVFKITDVKTNSPYRLLGKPFMFAGITSYTIDYSDVPSTNGISIETDYCFAGSTSVEFLTPSDGISYFYASGHCFYNMVGLTSFKVKILNSGTLELKHNCFENCSGLEKVYFDGGVITTNLAGTSGTYNLVQTFKGCTSLKSVVFNLASSRTITQEDAFPDNEELKIYFPDAMVDTIKSDTSWANLVNKIKPLSEYVEE